MASKPSARRQLVGEADGERLVVGEVAAEERDLRQVLRRDGGAQEPDTDQGSGTPTFTSLSPIWAPPRFSTR